jgi:hypothetical protein
MVGTLSLRGRGRNPRLGSTLLRLGGISIPSTTCAGASPPRRVLTFAGLHLPVLLWSPTVAVSARSGTAHVRPLPFLLFETYHSQPITENHYLWF